MDAYFDREASNAFHSSGATDFRDNGYGKANNGNTSRNWDYDEKNDVVYDASSFINIIFDIITFPSRTYIRNG